MSGFLEMIPSALIQLVMSLMAIFIILLVLVQRGRGGGLAGALGGPGGSSAFGAKAGDTFTKITIYVVSFWIVLCLMASIWAANRGDALGGGDASLAGDKIEAGAGAVDEPAADESAAEGGADEGAEPTGE